MAKIVKLGQFGHTFTRNFEHYVKTVEQRIHPIGEGTMKTWKIITYFIATPLVVLSSIDNLVLHHEKEERPEFIHYPYMKILNKKFPWGDGKHSLFHNPKVNWIPGVGYEE